LIESEATRLLYDDELETVLASFHIESIEDAYWYENEEGLNIPNALEKNENLNAYLDVLTGGEGEGLKLKAVFKNARC